jgi:hypothetical protein
VWQSHLHADAHPFACGTSWVTLQLCLCPRSPTNTGGYNFPGSNSGIDLFALTGWLPEQIFFEEHRKGGAAPKIPGDGLHAVALDCYQPAERVWQRLLSAHDYGDCLVTVSTEGVGDNLSEAEAQRWALQEGARAHAAVNTQTRELCRSIMSICMRAA